MVTAKTRFQDQLKALDHRLELVQPHAAAGPQKTIVHNQMETLKITRAIQLAVMCVAVMAATAGLDIRPAHGETVIYSETVTIAPYYETVEASGYYYFDPVDGFDIERDQVIIDDSIFSEFGGPISIESVAYRLDQGATSTSASFTDVQVRLSTAVTTPDTISTTLADNVGSDVTTVFSGPLTLSSPGGVGSPSAFDLVIPFSTPFVYDPTQGDLLFDWQYAGDFSGSSFRIDMNQYNETPFIGIITYAEDSRPVPDGVAEDLHPGKFFIAQFTVTPVPEPATGALLGLGLLALLHRNNRNRCGK